MRKLLVALFTMVGFTVFAANTERISMTVTVTNPAVTADVMVVNGAVRIWTNAHSSTTILTNLVSVNGSATNLFNNYASYPLGGGIALQWLDTNSFRFLGTFGGAMSGSVTGTWATLTLSTQSGPSTFTALYPMENIVGETNRTNQGSSLVFGLSAYSTNAFATNATALSNFVTKGAVLGPQHITSELRISGNINNGAGNLSVSNLVNIGNAIRSSGSGGNSFQAGSNAVASGPITLAIGNDSLASSNSALAVGIAAVATNDAGVAVGNLARTQGNQATALGYSAVAGTNSVALGNGSSGHGGSIAIGQDATADTGILMLAIGNNAGVTANYGTAVGTLAAVTHTNSTAIGANAASSAANQVMLGTSAETVVVPGMLSAATATNSVLRGTNTINGRLDLTPGTVSSLANGYNSAIVLGSNAWVKLSGPTAAYTNVGFYAAGAVSGSSFRLQMDNPGLSFTLLHDSGLDATAANRIYTGTGALLNSTNNPVFADLIYDGAVSRWRVVHFR